MQAPLYWQEVCALAAVEKDPKKLHALVIEINRLLQEKEDQLNGSKPKASPQGAPERNPCRGNRA